MRIRIFNRFFVLVMFIVLSLGQNVSEEDVYEEGYYEDTYEDGSVDVQVNNAGEVVVEPVVELEPIFGFHRNVGGGVVKISRRMVTSTFINDTATNYDCVKRADAHILAVEPVEEVIEDDLEAMKDIINDLRKRVGQAGISKNVTDGNSTNANSTTNVAKKEKEKKISFREKQDIKMRERRDKELEKEKVRPKFREGADCETLICGSCKSIVEEFGRALHAVINDNQYRYVEDVMKGFCKSKPIALKYVNLVSDICVKFEQESLGYRESLIAAYEMLPEGATWNEVKDWGNLNAKKKQVCVEVGACAAEDFRFQSKSEHFTQDQWDDKCFTCQAFANDLEAKVQLTRQVTEGSIVPIVKETCSRMDLEPRYQTICEQLIHGKLLDDISWLAKVHNEAIDRKIKGELRFADKLCQEIRYCTAYVDPVKLREKQAQDSMEAVFF